MNEIRLGIIGLGNIGVLHCLEVYKNNVKRIKLAAIADRNKEHREWAKNELSEDILIFERGEDMLLSKQIDAVLIATPHSTHSYFAKLAFENGLHVMCEKPAGVYTKEVREMISLSKKYNLKLGVMFNMRMNPIYRKLRELVQGGRYGALKRVNWIITDWYRTQAYYDSSAWRATWKGEGGGVLLNQAPHNLDLLIWICGMPKSVQAFCIEGHYHDIEAEDDVTAYLEFDNGATGIFLTSTGDSPGTNRLEITLEQAKIVKENDEVKVYALDQNEREYCYKAEDPFKKPTGRYVDFVVDSIDPAHNGVLEAFSSAILDDKELVATGLDGLNEIMLSNAMYLSSWKKCKIELPFDDDEYLELLNEKIKSSKPKKNVKKIKVDLSGTFGK